jgi:hypothetical protein
MEPGDCRSVKLTTLKVITPMYLNSNFSANFAAQAKPVNDQYF